MKVSDFYQPCKKNAYFNALSGANQHTVLAKAVKMVCELMLKGTEKDSILSKFQSELANQLQDYWYSFSWQKEQVIKDNTKKVERFLRWIGNVKVLDANVSVSIAHPNGTDLLDDSVSLLVQYGNHAYGAIMIYTDCNRFSKNGRTVHTQAVNNLHALVAKAALERRYPGITITSVYLTNSEDALGNIGDAFIIDNTRSSNVASVKFSDMYEKDVFCFDALYQRISLVVNTPLKMSCYGCLNSALCRAQSISSAAVATEAEESETEYRIPVFTEDQLKVVEHVDGPMLVCAGPGSGKTATLVGRIKSLMDKGIDADYILAITFTKEAAKVLEKRISSFCDDMPTVSTINALCYKILRENEEFVGKVKLLAQRDKLSVIEGLLEVMPSVHGLSSENLDGRNGLIKTVERRLDKYLALHGDKELFLKQCPELSYDFCEMADYYMDILKANGYITFQEQISLCVKFLTDYPDALRDYQNIYRYIMVDEFQDIDAMQAKFIYMLAAHENLVVVGDDDQAIYGFRGGSHRYMLEFNDMFPSAKKVVLKENFRSTKEIVKASQNIISENTERISKEITATREDGATPVILNGTGINNIESVVDSVIKMGYSYSDIAILSQKNATLESIKDQMSSPAVLEKSLLVNDPLFAGVYFSQLFIRSEKRDNRALLHLCQLFGVEPSMTGGDSLYDSIIKDSGLPEMESDFYETSSDAADPAYVLFAFLHMCYRNQMRNAAQYVQDIAFSLSMENSSALVRMGELMNENSVHSLDELFELMDYMVRFEDDTKVDVSGTDAVLLITNHESKGREFPVVILINDAKEVSEESRRVLYVAMTRAQDKLFVLTEENASSMLDAINQ